MDRRLKSSIIATSLALLLAYPGGAQAELPSELETWLEENDVTLDQDLTSLDSFIDPDLTSGLQDEISALPTSLAVWLAHHLPATMSSSGMGSGLNLSDEMGFAIGVIPIRMGFFNQFDKVFESFVGEDTDEAGGADFGGVSEFLREKTPPSMIWPQFGASVGVGIGLGIEVSADVQFVPDLNVTLLDTIDVTIGVFSVSSAVRWRINDPWGPLPAFIIGVGGSYYTGSMTFGAGSDEMALDPEQMAPLTDNLGDLASAYDIAATYSFDVKTDLEWSLYQVNPEVRLAWEFGPFQPYVGFGFAMTYGEVSGSARVSADVDIVATPTAEAAALGSTAQSFSESIQIDTKDTDGLSKVDPAAYTLRPHIGFDIDLGLFAITAQLDFAVMVANKGDLGGVSTDAVNDVYAKGAKTSVALVGLIAARMQF